MNIVKMSGTGNTFAFVDLRSSDALKNLLQAFKLQSLSEVAQQLCANFFKQNTDGAVFLFADDKTSRKLDFRWEFYNADGSMAEMCGNAARCVGQFAVDEKIVSTNKMKFGTVAGPVTATVFKDSVVEVAMPEIKLLMTPGQFSNGVLLDTGVPHFVLEKANLFTKNGFELAQLENEARQLRRESFGLPRGANITYSHATSADELCSASFERGVEAFTQACGTGVVAAAFVQSLQMTQIKKFTVHVPGGTLTVDFSQSHPLLKGKVEYIERREV